MIQSGITKGTPAKITFGAGVYFTGIAYDEKVAPTEEEIRAAIIGATQDGGTLTITPEFFDIPLDGANVKIEELKKKVGETAQMEVSFAELTANFMMHQAIAELTNTTDSNYEVLTSSEHLKKGHYYEGFGYCGHFIDGRPLIVIFKKALCTSGFTTDNKNKTNSVFKGTFEAHSDLDYGTTKLPYAIFIRKESGWESVTDGDVDFTGQG